MKPLKILYVSKLCSDKLLAYIFSSSSVKPGQEAQKFHRLLVEGFAFYPALCEVKTLSLLPVVSANHEKIFWKVPPETNGNVCYSYVPIINLPVLRELMVFIYSFFKVIAWNLLRRREDKVAICDALNLSISGATLLACKFMRTKVVGIVTDLPGLMVNTTKKNNLKYRVYKKMTATMITNFDKYIILTEQMNEVVNPHHRPAIVMEGLVDIKMTNTINSLANKDENRILIYAGGIYEQYGIKTLLEAFLKIKDDNLRLHIFGPGAMEKDMPYYMHQDDRIIYHGIIPNQLVVESQLKATLLINPRPATGAFAKFSFPSKNMEYMVSGTPMVTTKLPGMPVEYYEYVYLFEDESIQGMANTLTTLLSKSKTELIDFGAKAKQFVLENKSNVIQAKRILNFLNQC